MVVVLGLLAALGVPAVWRALCRSSSSGLVGVVMVFWLVRAVILFGRLSETRRILACRCDTWPHASRRPIFVFRDCLKLALGF